MAGLLISFEGGEGAGKSTAIDGACRWLEQQGHQVVRVREPGGTTLGERIREVLLDPQAKTMLAETELLLMFASRVQLCREIIEPALADGAIVVADRFTDASFAYQGAGRGLPSALIAELERSFVGRRPDLTFLLDLPVSQGLARIEQRTDEPRDRIEAAPQAFFERVRQGYLERAQREPGRFVVIDAGAERSVVAAAIIDTLATRLSVNHG